jgi:CDP-glucose 4,6-dehydratase
VTLYEVDSVFHLGAQTIVGIAQRAPHGTLEANVRGTYNLLEVCRRHADLVQRVVVASSDKAYGETDALPYTEDSPLAARHPYEVSKACGDLIAQSYHHTYGLPVTIARCGNIYGGGDLNWSRIVPSTIRSFLRDKPPVLRSDGTFVRDYLYVRDAATAYMHLADGLATDGVVGSAFNFSDESPLTVLELVEAIRERMGKSGIEPVVLDTAVGEIHDQVLSAARARAVLGWKPQHDLRAGLDETIAWYTDYLG